VKWHRRFLELAKVFASWSKDPSTQVGAVIVDGMRRVVGAGFNGFPRGIEDSTERLQDRPTKYAFVVHAEPNAILNAIGDVRGCTIYTWPFPPCVECAKLIIQAGIIKVICPPATEEQIQRWGPSMKVANTLFEEAGIAVEHIGGD
jgi:dCMP deaminase